MELSSVVELVNRAPSLQELHQIASITNNDVDVLAAILERVENNDVTGDSTDYHNLSCCYGRNGSYDLACRLLEHGLDSFPANVDLLADYLSYGSKGGKPEKCEEYKEKLMKIPYKFWTWRGFSFLIDYLLEEYPKDENKASKIELELKELCALFEQYFPEDESSYLSEYDVLVALGERKEAEVRLREVLEQHAVMPKCCLRYCDLMLERGEYEQVVKYAEQGIMSDAQGQSSISVGYLFFISGLARDAMIWRDKKFEDSNSVLEMYADFKIAEELFGNTHETAKRQIALRTKIMARKSNIPYKDNENNIEKNNE